MEILLLSLICYDYCVVLLTGEILHHLTCMKPYRYWDIYDIISTGACRISSIGSIGIMRGHQFRSCHQPIARVECHKDGGFSCHTADVKVRATKLPKKRFQWMKRFFFRNDLDSLPETNSLHLKNDGLGRWSFPFGKITFQGRTC